MPETSGSVDASRAVSDHGAMSSAARTSVSALAVVGASLLLGALTSWAQGVLPDALASFANSSSGWTVLTALLVAAARPSLVGGAVLGVVSFVSLVLGYTIGSELRGLTYDPLLWGVVGLVAGPFVGAAAAAIRGRDVVRAAVGAGALAGVLVADGIYGLTVVADSTSPVYWTLCVALGVTLVGAAAIRLRTRRAVVATLVTAIAATAALTAGYAVLNSGY